MEWLIFSFIIIALSAFMAVKIVSTQPSVSVIELNPPTIVVERFNMLSYERQEKALEIALSYNFTVETLANNMTVIYPKFSVEENTG